MNIRVAKPEDAEELLNIYKYYVENTTITFEYDTPSVEEFKNRIKNTLVRYPYLVAEDWTVETSIYVQNCDSRSGIGTLLYNELEKYLKLQNIINLNACITYPNEKSENFHKKFGYKTVAHFTKCGYKFGKWNDVIWMEKFIGEHSAVPNAINPFSKICL